MYDKRGEFRVSQPHRHLRHPRDKAVLRPFGHHLRSAVCFKLKALGPLGRGILEAGVAEVFQTLAADRPVDLTGCVRDN